MARKPPGKPGKPSNVKVQLSFDETTAKRLRLVAAELGLDQSEVVARLINANYSGVHLRGLNSQNEQTPPEGQGTKPIISSRSSETFTARINTIARSTNEPFDRALDQALNDD